MRPSLSSETSFTSGESSIVAATRMPPGNTRAGKSFRNSSRLLKKIGAQVSSPIHSSGPSSLRLMTATLAFTPCSINSFTMSEMYFIPPHIFASCTTQQIRYRSLEPRSRVAGIFSRRPPTVLFTS